MTQITDAAAQHDEASRTRLTALSEGGSADSATAPAASLLHETNLSVGVDTAGDLRGSAQSGGTQSTSQLTAGNLTVVEVPAGAPMLAEVPIGESAVGKPTGNTVTEGEVTEDALSVDKPTGNEVPEGALSVGKPRHAELASAASIDRLSEPVADEYADHSNERLADEITCWAGRIAAGEARLIGLIGEFDRREAWAGPGLLSCGHWLSWRLGLGLKAAHERVRVARALRGLPLIAEAFAAGRLSWTQVRALTRVTTTPFPTAAAADSPSPSQSSRPSPDSQPLLPSSPASPSPSSSPAPASSPAMPESAAVKAGPVSEQTWIDLARHTTGAQLEKLVRGVRRGQKLIEDQVDPELAQHRMRTRVSYDEDGTMLISCRLPAEDGAVLLAALDKARADLDRRQADQRTTDAGIVNHPPAPASSTTATVPDPALPDPTVPDPTLPDPGRLDMAPPDQALPDPAPVNVPLPRSSCTGGAAPNQPSAAGRDREPATGTSLTPASLRDALLQMAQSYLSADADADADGRPRTARQSRYRLTAQVDPLSGWARLADGELLPESVTGGLGGGSPAAPSLRGLTRQDLRRADLGRNQRLPDKPLRELLGTLDGERCRFPGCSRHRKLHAHHVTSWKDGGATDLDNLVLVCSRHHTVIHRDRFCLTLQESRALMILTAQGEPVLPRQQPPSGLAEDLDAGVITARTLPASVGTDRLDLRYAVSVLLQQAA